MNEPPRNELAQLILDVRYRRKTLTDSETTEGLKYSDKTAQALIRAHQKADPKRTIHLSGEIDGNLYNIEGDSMTAIRDRALIAIGFAGFLRRSELVSLTVENLEWSTEEVHLHLATSKTDQAGHGAVVRVEGGDAVSPPELLREWLEAADITGGPIFRGVYKSGKLRTTPLTGRAVSTIVKNRAEAAGIDPELVSVE